MAVCSFHLARSPAAATARALIAPPRPRDTPGLIHAEPLAAMTLGAPALSPSRMQLRTLAVFAAWESEGALEAFLGGTALGRTLAAGWHVRLALVRRWGRLSELDGLPVHAGPGDPDAPVVAVTLARMRLAEVPRFVSWGKPVERLVRDHPGTTLALAAMRPPRTVCTFSVWRSQREMVGMVRGTSDVPGAERHAAAMAERERRPFHHEFTTLRFRPLAEHGAWGGRRGIVPGLAGGPPPGASAAAP